MYSYVYIRTYIHIYTYIHTWDKNRSSAQCCFSAAAPYVFVYTYIYTYMYIYTYLSQKSQLCMVQLVSSRFFDFEFCHLVLQRLLLHSQLWNHNLYFIMWYILLRIRLYIEIRRCVYKLSNDSMYQIMLYICLESSYAVATNSKLLKITGLFCKRAL